MSWINEKKIISLEWYKTLLKKELYKAKFKCSNIWENNTHTHIYIYMCVCYSIDLKIIDIFRLAS